MKKFYFVLIINNKSKNIFENNMNKKQLTESIMAGVRRAFRENKSLNEGFSQWKEQNVPKIDYDTLKTNINNLSTVLEQLMGSKQIDTINVVYHNEALASWATLIEIVSPSIIVKSIYDAFKQLKSKYCENDEDKFVQAINNLYFKLYIPKTSHLMKYIQSTLVPGSNKIKDMSYFTLVKTDDNHIGLRFSIKSILDNCDEIIEYFS